MEDQHCTSQLQPARAGAFLGGKIISLTELGRAEFLLSSELTLFALNTNITDGATILCHPDYRGVISLYSELSLLLFSTSGLLDNAVIILPINIISFMKALISM